MNKHPSIDCFPCRFLGRVAPWAFLIVAAAIAALPLNEGWQRASAYLSAAGLALLAGALALSLFERLVVLRHRS